MAKRLRTTSSPTLTPNRAATLNVTVRSRWQPVGLSTQTRLEGVGAAASYGNDTDQALCCKGCFRLCVSSASLCSALLPQKQGPSPRYEPPTAALSCCFFFLELLHCDEFSLI